MFIKNRDRWKGEFGKVEVSGNVHGKPLSMRKGRFRKTNSYRKCSSKTIIYEKENSGKVEVSGNVHGKPLSMRKGRFRKSKS